MVQRKTRTIKKCGFKTNKDNSHVHSVSFNDLTDGEFLALINALRLARQVSAVADDLSSYLRNALQESESPKAKAFLQDLNEEIRAEVVPG